MKIGLLCEKHLLTPNLIFMKKFSLAIVMLVAVFGFVAHYAEAASRVSGYTTSRGTYVQPYYRSDRNSTKLDNYSTKGNYNPYTGKKGYVNPYRY
jgi:hypothetical protein